jgi:hypothetical protein
MRNVTITLEEKVAQWARVEAARRDTSVSRMVGEMLTEKMKEDAAYDAAQARCFSVQPRVMGRPGDRLPTRDEIYDRPFLR